MKNASQSAAYRCECGCYTLVEQISPWEFSWRCAACKRGGVISWSHAAPPPSFEKAVIQVELFS